MRAIVLAVVLIQLGLGLPARAEDSSTPAASNRPVAATLPLFEKNQCGSIKDPADQLFCGDPELNGLATKLSAAIRGRVERLSDRRLAIAENAEWITNRNSSCGIFGNQTTSQTISNQDFSAIRQCLLKETEERIAILEDPNFDCLAANTAAGALICSDPSLAIAEADLNDHALALIAKLKEDEARNAYDEYARWIRNRDRKCGLVGKENVPLEDVSSSEDCLADFMNAKTAELIAAKGDPKRIFGRHQASPSPERCFSPFAGDSLPCSTVPVQVTGPSGTGHLTHITAISAEPSANGLHVMALRSDGTVWSWGVDDLGQLGNGKSEEFDNLPSQVVGPNGRGHLQHVVSIAAGGGFSMARLADGSIWTWGENSSGQLGIGNATGPSVCTSEHTPCSLVPVPVKGADGAGKFSGSVAISAGQEHAAALRAP